MYEEDFVKEEIASFEIEGRKFRYMPTTAGDELDWINLYISTDENGKQITDYAKLNKLKMLRLVDTPYKFKDTSWKDLSDTEKWNLLRKLNGAMFDKILKEITRIDKGETTKKKD